MQYPTNTKRRRNVSVAKIRLTLMAIVAMQFSNLSFITSQLSHFILGKDDVPLKFRAIDFTSWSNSHIFNREIA